MAKPKAKKTKKPRTPRKAKAPVAETTTAEAPAKERNAFTPTDDQRDTVKAHAAFGTPQKAIAKELGIHPETLRKYFAEELQEGLDEANATIAGTLYAQAVGGNTVAMIFWLKTRARWRETDRLEITGKDGRAIEVNQHKLDLESLSDDELSRLEELLNKASQKKNIDVGAPK